MPDYTRGTWVDDDGSGTTGTLVTKAIMDNIELGVKDAAQDSKQRGPIGSRPPASADTKNWIWVASDQGNRLSYCDGAQWYSLADAAPTISDGTTLPSAAATPDGAEYVIAPFSGSTVRWRFRLHKTDGNWKFMGGAAIYSELVNDESIAAATTTYVDLATAGPSLTVPYAGFYQLEFGARAYPWGVGQWLYMSPHFTPTSGAAVAPVDENAVLWGQPAGLAGTASRFLSWSVSAAQGGGTFKMQYKHDNSAAQANFSKRWLKLLPTWLIGPA